MSDDLDFTGVRRALATVPDAELEALTRVVWETARSGRETFPRSAAVADAAVLVLAEEADRRSLLLDHAARQVDPDHGAGGAIVTDPAAMVAAARRELRASARSEAGWGRRIAWVVSGRWLHRFRRSGRRPAVAPPGE